MFAYGPSIESLVITVLIAFIPSLVYLILIRYSEKYEREPWGSLGTTFLWGATMSVVIVIIVRGMFLVTINEWYPDLASDKDKVLLLAVVLITPFIAEIIKPVGLYFINVDIDEAEDGLIYGASIGLGFAATENLIYGIFVVTTYGLELFIFTIFIRSISVVLLHASCTSITGYGISRATAKRHATGRLYAFPLFLLLAISTHSLFNYLAITQTGKYASYQYSLLVAIAIAVVSMSFIYFKIWRLDRLDEKPKAAPASASRPTVVSSPRRNSAGMRSDESMAEDWGWEGEGAGGDSVDWELSDEEGHGEEYDGGEEDEGDDWDWA